MNLKHEAFCRSYLLDEKTRFNATRTYMRVYPKASYETALVNGPRLLGKTRNFMEEILFGGLERRELDRLCQRLKKLLDAKKPHFWKGKVVGYEPDGKVQLKTLNLLSLIFGDIR